MKISALVDIAEGELQNTPSISFTTQIHTNITKISDGDTFIAINHKEIPKALEQGAFVILYENDVVISDSEIAWIKVPSIHKSITNILRYGFSKLHDVQFFYVDKILFHFLDLFKTKEKSIILLSNNIKNDFETLMSNRIVENTIVFSTNNHFLQKVSPTFKIMQPSKYSIYNLTSFSLFETSFSYKGIFFDRIKLPKLYINYFLSVYNFFDSNIDIKKINKLSLLKPIFINKSVQIVPFGQTNRFILAAKDVEVSKLELRYINKEYKYGTIKVIDKENLSEKQIINYIKKYSDKNLLYFKYHSIESIEKTIQNQLSSPTLF